MVVFRSNQEWDGRLVESSSLSVPFFDAIERALPRQVEHEQDRNGIVAHQRQHIDELPLPSQIPNRKGDLGVPYRYRLLHEVDSQRLNVVLIPAPLHILDHERRLANLCIAHHADLDDHAVLVPVLVRGRTAGVLVGVGGLHIAVPVGPRQS